MDRTQTSATVIALVTVIAALSLGFAGTAGAVQEGESGELTVINECTTIEESGTYILGNDIEDSDVEACIQINASDVVLEGDGNTVGGVQNENDFEAFQEEVVSGGAFPWEEQWRNIGVHVTENQSDVTVRNLELRNWFFGFYADNGTADVSVQGITATDNADVISFYNAEDVSVTDSEIEGSSAAVVFDSTTNATARNNTMTDNVDGVLAVFSSDVDIDENTMTDNEDGAFIYNVSDVDVDDNIVTGSLWTAFAVYHSDDSEFVNNTIAETQGTTVFRHDAADIIIHNTNNSNFQDTTVHDSEANWTVYATNNSYDNTGDNFTVENVTLEYTVTDAAFKAGEDVADTTVEGDTPLLTTNLGNASELDLEIDWPVAEELDPENATETPVDEPPVPVANETTEDPNITGDTDRGEILTGDGTNETEDAADGPADDDTTDENATGETTGDTATTNETNDDKSDGDTGFTGGDTESGGDGLRGDAIDGNETENGTDVVDGDAPDSPGTDR